jgi:5-methyltetrahydrofolate--homocysteine methyltransferase
VASLYSAVSLRQENSYFSIGERCNANGSKAWRALQEAGDWDGCVAVGREQVGEGSNSSTSAPPSSAATRWPR